MNADEYRQVCEAFHELEALEQETRDERLAQLQSERDAEFVAALRELLDAPDMEQLAETRLGQLGRGVLERAAQAAEPWHDPERIGSYRLLRRLGEGGMGIVYEAQRDDSSQRAALKVIRPEVGNVDTSGRFEREVGVLQQLRHPGIAAFFDAGKALVAMSSGAEVSVPYLAMEAVDGVPLDRHADARGLDAAGRLELMARVCDAIHHAHEQGIIHRDLKPGNVLVLPPQGDDRIGQPKVLDFGLARATSTDDPTLTRTRTGMLMGTLPYMSPEQVAGRMEDLDRRSDVYSLGVMLFELLSGQLPYPVRGRSLAEGARVIQMDEPSRVASLVPSLAGSVDHVVSQALEKDTDRRYASAADFATDLRAAAAGRVVMARGPGLVRRLNRWMVRHPMLGGASLVGIGSLVVLSWLLTQSLEATEIAQREATTAERALVFMTTMYAAEEPDFARGETITVREVLEREAERIDEELADEPALRARLMAALGGTFHSLGLLDRSGPLLQQAWDLSRELHGEEHLKTMRIARMWAGLCLTEARHDEAAEITARVLEVRARQLGPDHLDTLEARSDLAHLAVRRAQFEDAESQYRALLADYERVHPGDTVETITCRGNIALCVERLGRYDESGPMLDETRERARSLLGDRHPQTVILTRRLAGHHVTTGQLDEAAELSQAAVDDARAVWGHDSASALASLVMLSDIRQNQGRYEEQLEIAEEALEGFTRIYSETHPSTLGAKVRVGYALRSLGMLEASEIIAQQAVDALREQVADDRQLASGLLLLASLREQTGRLSEAEAILLEALQLLQRISGPRSRPSITAWNNLGHLYIKSGRLKEADAIYQKATPLALDALGPGGTVTLAMRVNRAYLSKHFGRLDEAEADLVAAAQDARTLLGPEHPQTAVIANLLREFYISTGQPEKAAAVNHAP